ncbi:MAG: mechanosensitive ion channel family protein [Limnochordales bacterium]|nr:mechanosensitive ion channel protein MscS [Bacillota bacterium]
MLEAITEALNGGLTAERLMGFAKVLGQIVLLFLAARLLLSIVYRIIDHTLANESRRSLLGRDPQRDKTVASLLKSVSFYTVFFIAGLMALEMLGVNTSSLLAAAGVAGLAIGIGAQNLVKDVVNGFFILFEGQFRVGDYVGINDVEGFVEQTGLRTTWIRTWGGEVHIIPNGEVRKVINYMGPQMRVMFGVPIAFEEDVDKAISVLEEAFARARADGTLDKIVDGPKVLGVSNISEAGVELLIWARSEPLQQWEMGRRLRKLVKKTLDEHGIKLGYPRRHVVVYAPGGAGGGSLSG